MNECTQSNQNSAQYVEKEMATHSSILAWEIPWTKEPGRLQFMGSQRVQHDLATKKQHIKVSKNPHSKDGLIVL